MIQRVLTKYGLAAHVAFICFFPLAYSSNVRCFKFAPLLWLSLVAVEMMFLLPSVRHGETLSDARRRVVSALVWDPFFYVGLAVLAIAVAQFLNGGCGLIYLPDADIWQVGAPVVAWAPFCVEPLAAFTMLAVLSSCWVVGVILRIVLSKTCKRLLLFSFALASGFLAVYSVAQACLSVKPYVALTPGLTAPALGTFFGFWMLMGMGLVADALARFQRGVIVLFLLGFGANLVGMLFFSDVLTGAVYSVLAILLLLYSMSYLVPHVPKHVQFKLFLSYLFVGLLVVGTLVFVFPKNPVVMKIHAAFPLAEYWQNAVSIREVRFGAAMRIWQEHPWIGVGADGFYHFVGLSVGTKDWALLKADQGYVYNDWIQFLCEYGVIGAGLFLAAVVVLLVPICNRARIAWKFGTKDENDGRVYLLRLSPIVVVGVLATSMCFVESWVSSPFRMPGLLMSWICVMSCMPAFLPSVARSSQ